VDNSNTGSIVSPEILASLDRAIASGRMTLVLGDLGVDPYEQGAVRSGSLQLLRRDFLSIVGLEETDQSIGLHEAHEAAMQSDPAAVEIAIESRTEVDAQLEWTVRTILRGPWERIYDLAVLNFSAFKSPEDLPRAPFVDGSIEYQLDHDKGQLVQICGSRERPQGVLFEPPNGNGKSPRERWFQTFAADLVTRSVLVFAARTHPELWSFLRVRSGDLGSYELPQGFLVTEHLTAGDNLRCKNCRLSPIAEAISPFVKRRLAPNIDAIAAGHRQLLQIRNISDQTGDVQLVSSLLRKLTPATWEFLRGHDPQWADVADTRLARLTRLTMLYKDIELEEGKRNIVLLTGAAGSGKTALLMRLAYELHLKSYKVAWIDRSASQRLSALGDHLDDMQPDVVVIDDLDIFHSSGVRFARRMNKSGKRLVVASVRSTRRSILGSTDGLRQISGDHALADKDLRALVKVLENGGLLGTLTDLPEDIAVEKLRELSQRDLLAALIEVVHGQPFTDRVRSEYEQLPQDRQEVYALTCLGSSRVYEDTHLPEEDLLQILGPIRRYLRYVQEIQRLVEDGLLVRDSLGLRVRHRAIADAVVDGFSEETVASICERMLLFYAGRASHITDPAHPDRRHMITLLSHSRMIDLRIDPALVRPIYEKAQSLLGRDFHFWLQRAAYEVERGDLDLADSYLQSARQCKGGADDYLVTTEWGLLRLLKAKANPQDRSAQDRAKAAVDLLEEIAYRFKDISPHTFTVLVQHGTEWLEKDSSLSQADRVRYANRLEEIRKLGAAEVNNTQFDRASRKFASRLGALIIGESPPNRYPL
jgi:energy-coupling factor transporter ATP-binding protein EcfA2